MISAFFSILASEIKIVLFELFVKLLTVFI